MEKKILIVEDDCNIQQTLAELVELANYQWVLADNGAVALELLQTNTFNLITLDLKMPVMDGNQFLEILPQYAPTTPVIIISGDLDEVKTHCQIKALLGKPFRSDQLLRLITSFIS